MRKKNKLFIGITGGIASGKSTVARLFKKSGGRLLIDADEIGHRILNNSLVRNKLANHFGPKILDKSGKINRQYLGNLSFRDKKNILTLNRLSHPFIHKEIDNRIKKIKKGIIILDAALLMETGLNKLCDYLVFVDTNHKKRWQRAIQERNWSKDELTQRERFQIPLRIKKKQADFIVRNNNDLNSTGRQVISILRKIKKGENS